MDEIERSRNRAPDTVTEMNFGLRFAENGASRVTRQTWTTVNVSENCCNPVCALAVGLKPPAMECEARLRGLGRIISSKTIISVHTLPEASVWRDTAGPDRGQLTENCYKTSQIFRRQQHPTNHRCSRMLKRLLDARGIRLPVVETDTARD